MEQARQSTASLRLLSKSRPLYPHLYFSLIVESGGDDGLKNSKDAERSHDQSRGEHQLQNVSLPRRISAAITLRGSSAVRERLVEDVDSYCQKRTWAIVKTRRRWMQRHASEVRT